MFDAAYWRAKEGELARTITGSPDVRSARVHLANPVSQPFSRTPAGSASVTVTTAHKMRIINVWCVNAAVGTASDTITIKNGATAISNAMDINKADKTVTTVGTLDDAQWDIASGGSYVVTETDGAGNDSPAVDVYAIAIKVA